MKELRFFDSAVDGLVLMMGCDELPLPPPPASLPAPAVAATLGAVRRQSELDRLYLGEE